MAAFFAQPGKDVWQRLVPKNVRKQTSPGPGLMTWKGERWASGTQEGHRLLGLSVLLVALADIVDEQRQTKTRWPSGGEEEWEKRDTGAQVKITACQEPRVGLVVVHSSISR